MDTKLANSIYEMLESLEQLSLAVEMKTQEIISIIEFSESQQTCQMLAA